MDAIDQLNSLKEQYDKILTELQNLKNEIAKANDSNVKEQVNNWYKNASNLEFQINSKIEEINAGNDENAKTKANEIKSAIESKKSEIDKLYKELQDSLNSTETSSTWTASSEAKNFLGKWWWWVKKQRKDVLDENKWKEEKWNNILRTALFAATWIWWIALAYKWLKKLFWWKKDGKKSFWDKWYGKALKWTAITAWGIFGINWLWKKAGFWWTDEDHPTDKESPEVKYKAFDKLDETTKEKYNKIGDQIDWTYEKLFNRELLAWYQDEMAMTRVADAVNGNLKNTWIIPFCLDNKFWSVEDLLWQNNSMTEAIRWWVQKMVLWLKSQWNNVLETFASCYLSKLPSWTGMKFVATTLEWKVTEWTQKNTDAQKELEYFFRQSIRVERYFFEKKRQLEYKLAEMAANTLGDGKKPDDILNDDSLYEDWIENNPTYQTFLHSSILISWNTLETEQILDNNISKETEDAVTDLDNERDTILSQKPGDKDVIQAINEKVDKKENIENEKAQLATACTNLSKDIEETIIPALKDSPIAIREELLGTSDNPEIKQYIQKGWLVNEILNFRSVLAKWKTDLTSGNLKPEEVKEIAWGINNMIALKKEIILWAWTIWMEDGNIVFSWVKFIYWSVKNIWEWAKKILNWQVVEWLEYIGCGIPWVLLWVWAVEFTIWWWMVVTWRFGKWFRLMWKWLKTATLPIYPLYFVAKWGLSKAWRYSSSMSRNLLLKSKRWQRFMFTWENAMQSFEQALHQWKITLSDAEDILARKVGSWNDKISSARMERFKVDAQILRSNQDVLHLKKCLFDDYVGNLNKNLLTKIKNDKELYEKAIKWFDKDSCVKDFIRSWGNVDDLRQRLTSLEEAEARLLRESKYTPKDLPENIKNIWENSTTIKNEFKNEREYLENEIARKEKEIEKAESKKINGNADKISSQNTKIEKARNEIENLKKQISNLDSFEHEIKELMVAEKDETAAKNILSQYETLIKKLKSERASSAAQKSMTQVIKQIQCLEKLQNFTNSDWAKYFKNLQEVLDTIDAKLINKLVSEGKIADSEKAVFTRLANNIADIRLASSMKFEDDAVKAIAKLIKIASKIKI